MSKLQELYEAREHLPLKQGLRLFSAFDGTNDFCVRDAYL